MTNHIGRYDVLFDYAGKKTGIQVTFADGSTRGADGRASALIDFQSTVDFCEFNEFETHILSANERERNCGSLPRHIHARPYQQRSGDYEEWRHTVIPRPGICRFLRAPEPSFPTAPGDNVIMPRTSQQAISSVGQCFTPRPFVHLHLGKSPRRPSMRRRA
jgi:hypothetical protein